MQSAGITPLFVFSGMDASQKNKAPQDDEVAARANTHAWELYDQHKPVRAVETFGDSGACREC